MQIGTKALLLSDRRTARFRPVTPDDDQFLTDVYGSTRDDELALTDWDAERRAAFIKMQFNAQRAHYREYYPTGEYYVLLTDAEAIGRLYVAEIENEVRILDITILPKHRGSGVGTRIIKELQLEGNEVGKPVRIYVESFNRSLGLFRRLGFSKVDENEYSYLMEWRPEKFEQPQRG